MGSGIEELPRLHLGLDDLQHGLGRPRYLPAVGTEHLVHHDYLVTHGVEERGTTLVGVRVRARARARMRVRLRLGLGVELGLGEGEGLGFGLGATSGAGEAAEEGRVNRGHRAVHVGVIHFGQ